MGRWTHPSPRPRAYPRLVTLFPDLSSGGAVSCAILPHPWPRRSRLGCEVRHMGRVLLLVRRARAGAGMIRFRARRTCRPENSSMLCAASSAGAPAYSGLAPRGRRPWACRPRRAGRRVPGLILLSSPSRWARVPDLALLVHPLHPDRAGRHQTHQTPY
jgi:hypothetical protein